MAALAALPCKQGFLFLPRNEKCYVVRIVKKALPEPIKVYFVHTFRQSNSSSRPFPTSHMLTLFTIPVKKVTPFVFMFKAYIFITREHAKYIHARGLAVN